MIKVGPLQSSEIILVMMPTPHFLHPLHHTNDPAKHPQKPSAVWPHPKDDFVWPGEFIDSDILDLLDLNDYCLPDRPFPTDA